MGEPTVATRVLVTGATGNVGRALIDQLRAARVPVRALTRHPQQARFSDDVAVIGGDLERPTTLAAPLDGVSAVFLMGPVSSVACHAANFCRAVRLPGGAGVRHVVLLSSSIVELNADDPYSRQHRMAERHVTDSGLPWTILRPGAFTSNAAAWAGSIRAEGVVRSMTGNFPVAPIDPYDIAAVAFDVLTSGAHFGRTYALTGPERLSPADQVGVLSEVLRRPLRLVELSVRDALGILQQSNDRRDAASLLRSLRRPDVPWAHPLPTVEQLTGRTPRTFHDWASQHHGAFA